MLTDQQHFPLAPQSHLCQFPRGDGQPDWDFCGADIEVLGASYCDEHWAKCYRPDERRQCERVT